MDISELKKIITRQLFGQATEEEMSLLRQWEAEAEANRRLLEKLTSETFLRKAMSDRNRELRMQEWEKLERLTTRKRARVIRMRWLRVAAVMVPIMCGLAVWQLRDTPIEEDFAEVTEQISGGSSKAMVELAGGKQIFLTNDTTLTLVNQGVQLVNRKDTLEIVSNRLGNARTGEFHMIRIPRGGEYIARLEDGTVIHLNSGSEIKIPVDFGIAGRDVWLKGEAFFDVAHDKGKVFTVHTDKADIAVLGTEFDVRAYEDELDVVTTLVEGAVKVNSGDASNRLKPGFQARVSEKGKISTRQVDVYPYVAWVKGRMVFEDERLEKIMTDLQRWYDFEVFYTRPEMKDLRFTMDILKYDDIAKVLNLMEKMDKVTFTRKGRSVVLDRR